MGKPQRHNCHETVTIALIAAGSNLGSHGESPADTVRAAFDELGRRSGHVPRISRFFANPAFPPGSGPDFVNAAATLEWAGPAEALLELLHAIEEDFGRTRRTRWEARALDLDLLALGDQVRPDRATQASWAELSPDAAASQAPGELILPHPRLAERAFVLVPLAEVAPDWRHPVTGLSVVQMRDALEAADIAQMTPV